MYDSSANQIVAFALVLLYQKNSTYMCYCGLFLLFNQVVGLVENQSDWYLGKLWKNHKPWPAVVSLFTACM